MNLRTMGRALAVLFVFGAVLGAVVPVGAAAPEPRSALGVSSGKAFRAGWYEDITGDCNNIKDAAAGLFGSVTGGGGQISYLPGVGLLGATTAPAATGFGATFLAGIGAGGAAVTAAQAAAVAAVGVTGFCAGLLGAQWISGNAPYTAPTYNGPFFTYNQNGTIPCQQITGFVPVFAFSMCQRFSPNGSSFVRASFMNQFGEYLPNAQNGGEYWSRNHVAYHGGLPPNTFLVRGPESWNTDVAGFSGNTVLELDCRTATICAVKPNSPSNFFSWGYDVSLPVTGALDNPTPQRLNARAYCQSPSGTTQLFSSVGPWSNGVDSATNPDSVLCPAGWLRLTYNLDIQTLEQVYRTSDSLSTMPDLSQVPVGGENLVSWVIPTYVQSNPVLRQCYLEGFTNCEATTTGGVTTVNNTVTSQTTNVTVGGAQTTVTQVLEPIRDAIATVAPPTTVPATTVPPTTVPATTVPPTTVPVTTPTTVPCSGIACQSSDPDPPDGDTDGCFSTGYSWNPVSWVLVPIKCSFTWLFVPSGSAWDEVTADLDGLSGSPPLSWVVGGSQLLTGSSVQFVRWADADLPSFTVQGYTFDFASLDGAEAPTAIKVMLIIALWILLAYCVVRFL